MEYQTTHAIESASTIFLSSILQKKHAKINNDSLKMLLPVQSSLQDPNLSLSETRKQNKR